VRTALRPLILIAVLLAAGAGVAAGAVDSPKAPASRPSAKYDSPSWAQLSSDQKEALAPLAADWDKYDPLRKKKWLEIAARYKDLSPEGQQRLHQRMPELARLTAEQRKTARENFTRAYELPPEKRRVLTQKFQDLPEDKKRELAEQAHKKPAPAPRRPGASGASSASKAPAPAQNVGITAAPSGAAPAAPAP